MHLPSFIQQPLPVLCLLLACNTSATSRVVVEITAGLTPEYRWSTGSGFSVGVVRLTAPATVVWGVADPRARLNSPVRHGSLPQHTDQLSNLEPRLTAGVRYRVTVALADGRTGSREFTPAASTSSP